MGSAATPTGADGAPCDWDERDGCWRESDGTPFDPKRAATRKKTHQREAQSEASKRAEREAKAAKAQAKIDRKLQGVLHKHGMARRAVCGRESYVRRTPCDWEGARLLE